MNISETDLILNADGSAYHLNLLPQDVADTVILVGDQDRVAEISKHFDSVELRKGKREFITHTGRLGSKRISVISTGIGTDNVDIVINELDALVNINLQTLEINKQLRSLDLIRIGTSGATQANIPVDSLLVSEYAFGLDALMHYYRHSRGKFEQDMLNAFTICVHNHKPYLSTANSDLLTQIGADFPLGITVTSPGFYAPQGRTLRAAVTLPGLIDRLQQFNFGGKVITNLEMETAGIYGMAAALGHRALSFNVILANRITNTFSKQPADTMNRFIVEVLTRLHLL